MLTQSNRKTSIFTNLLTKEFFLVFLLASSTAIMNIGFGMIIPIYPKFLAKSLDDRVFILGLIIASFAFGQLIFAPIVGYLADAKNCKKLLMILSLLGYSLSNFIFPYFINNYQIVILIRFIQGATVAGVIPISLAFLSDLTKGKNRTRNFSIILGSASIGWVVGPMIGGIFYEVGDFSFPFFIIALFSLVSAFFIAIIPKPKIKDKIEKSIIVEGERLKYEAKQTISFKEKINLQSILLQDKKSIFISLLFISFIDYWAWALIEPGLPFYVFENLNVSTLEFGVFIGFYGIVIASGQFLLGNLSNNFDKKNIIIIAGLFHFLGYFTLGFATTFIDLLFMATLTGFGMALLVPAVASFLIEISQDGHRTLVISLITVGAQVAGIFAPLLGGYLSNFFSMEILIWISAFSLLLIPVVIMLQDSKKKVLVNTKN